MQKEKKVRIELPATIDGTNSNNPPVKFKKSKMSPTSNNFLLAPAYMPQIKELIISVTWNSVNKTIHIKARENLHFDVYRWVKSIKEIYAELQKGPFLDLEQNAILLHFLDNIGHEIATLKFKELKLVNHQVDLTYEKSNNVLMHDIHIEYKDIEEIDITEFVDWSTINPADQNKESDEEWQTVEE